MLMGMQTLKAGLQRLHLESGLEATHITLWQKKLSTFCLSPEILQEVEIKEGRQIYPAKKNVWQLKIQGVV